MCHRQCRGHTELPEEKARTEARLRAEAERSSVTATTLARQALEEWLRKKRRSHLRRAIETYAAEAAGSTDDLDEGTAGKLERQVASAKIEFAGTSVIPEP